jgi:hypothetical protein
MVEDIRGKADRTLPLLWYKWKLAGIKGVLHRGIKTCIQMDKQAESEKEFYLWTVLPIQRTQSIAKAKDISLNIYLIVG